MHPTLGLKCEDGRGPVWHVQMHASFHLWLDWDGTSRTLPSGGISSSSDERCHRLSLSSRSSTASPLGYRRPLLDRPNRCPGPCPCLNDPLRPRSSRSSIVAPGLDAGGAIDLLDAKLLRVVVDGDPANGSPADDRKGSSYTVGGADCGISDSGSSKTSPRECVDWPIICVKNQSKMETWRCNGMRTGRYWPGPLPPGLLTAVRCSCVAAPLSLPGRGY